MKKTLIISLILYSSNTFSYDFMIDNIAYNIISGNTVETTYENESYKNGYNSYTQEEIIIPNKVVYNNQSFNVIQIGEYSFRNCKALKKVTLPNTIRTIEKNAFAFCYELEDINIPEGCYKLSGGNYSGNGAFDGCDALRSITLPTSISIIGKYCFEGCDSLKHIVGLENTKLSTIENCAFGYCDLYEINLPVGLQSIDKSAFKKNVNLQSIIIPVGVKKIEYSSFEGCENVQTIISHCLTPPEMTKYYINNKYTYGFEKKVFENATLYVPEESIELYQKADGWKQFVTIKGIEDVVTNKCLIPNIYFKNKKLIYSCETDGVEFVSEIKDADIKKYYDSEVSLSATYEISVYATKSGYENSDVATATLVWTDAIFTETTPSTSSAKAIAESIPMLISAQNGTITVRGEQNGHPLTIYTADGKMLGSAMMKDGQASFVTNLQRGEIAIVKVGSKSVKIKM